MRPHIRMVVVVIALVLGFLLAWRFLGGGKSVTSPPPSVAKTDTTPIKPPPPATPPPSGPAPVAPVPEQKPEPPPTTGPGVIHGDVKWREQPAADATVVLSQIQWDPERQPDTMPRETGLRHETTSDADGKFSFSDLPIGRFALRAYTEYGFGLREAFIRHDGIEYEVTIELKPFGTIAGTVVNEREEPLANAVVYPRVNDPENRPIGMVRSMVVRTTTDDQGAFRFERLWLERWRLLVKAEGYAPYFSDWIRVGDEAVVLRIGPGGSISGTVEEAQSASPVVGVRVMIRDKEQWTPVETRSDENGQFQLSAIVPGPHRLLVNDERYILQGDLPEVTVAEGQETSGIKIIVTAGGVIRGRVYDRDSGEGIPGVEVRADSRIGNPKISKSDLTGAYAIQGLPSGPCQVTRGEAKGYAQARYQDRLTVSVESGQETSGVDFALAKGLTVSGRVVDVAGNPIAGAQVRARSVSAGSRDSEAARTGLDGVFEIGGLSATNQLYVSAEKEGLAAAPVGPTTLTDAPLTDIVITLSKAGTVAGTVVDNNGRPLAGVHVHAYSRNPMSSHFAIPSSQTDASGNFLVRGLFADTYGIGLRSPASRGPSMREEHARVDVGPGQDVTGVRIQFEPTEGLNLAGRVTDTSGQPVSRATVQAQGGGSSGPSFGTAQSDADGRYRITGLTDGVFNVALQHPKYSRAQAENIESGREDVDFVLVGRGNIAGQVVDAQSGQPIAQFDVFHIAEQYGRQIQPWMYERFVSMHNPDGSFNLNDLETGDGVVVARAPGYSVMSEPVTVTPGETLSGVVVRLQRGRTVEGIVANSQGLPVAGAMLFVDRLPDEWQRERSALARSGADGSFRVDAPPPDVTQIVAWHPNYAPGSAPVGDAPLQIVLSSGGTVEGVVTLDGEPVVGQTVNVGSGTNRESVSHGQTDATGAYRVTGVAPGEVEVFVSITNFAQGGRDSCNLKQLALVENDRTTPVDFNLGAANAILEGTIRRNGQPVAASINLISNNSSGGYDSYGTYADANGFYRFDTLSEGTWRMEVGVLGSAGASGIQRRLNVATVANQTVRQDVDLSGGIAVVGRIVGIQPDWNCSVAALEGQVNIARYSDWLEQGIQSMVTSAEANASGQFRLEGLPPGTYTITAGGVPGTVRNAAEASAQGRVASTVVNLTEGHEVTVELQLK
ncbi:MAG: carboxypeptidase regulatory-like domain-containing protein [Candidatus Hydrogenedentes bacterium]|nr:carboxypeptidase regulatory-like domain-containing protein [Candidatus Hydrogenedentota bacterium]